MILTTDKHSLHRAANQLDALVRGLRERAHEARYEIVHIGGALPVPDSDELPSDEQRRQIFAALGLAHCVGREDLAEREVCPTCCSPSPERHPAVAFEGEVQPCKDAWHTQRLATETDAGYEKRMALLG